MTHDHSAAHALDTAIAAVVSSQLCSGCGACTQLDAGLRMTLDTAGYLRPVRESSGAAINAAAAQQFAAICPGVSVTASCPAESTRHPMVGPVVSAWEAWATDDAVRRVGSSGGVLSALQLWMVESGRARQSVAAAAARDNPRTTVSVRITTRDEALAAAGSRYAPVASAAHPDALDPAGVFTGKPCEVQAVRALAPTDSPVLLAFYCAGTPSQNATDGLVARLGIAADEPLTRLRYRGDGWPGSFVAESATGSTVTTTYDDSWGSALGPTIQWRCKICPDGVGESADITAADFWRTDERGYPVFVEGDGVSAVIARTVRGHELLLDAMADGVIAARPITPAQLSDVQPFQRKRRVSLAARMLGSRLAGRATPRVTGFGLLRLAGANLRFSAATAKGTWQRVRAGQS